MAAKKKAPAKKLAKKPVKTAPAKKAVAKHAPLFKKMALIGLGHIGSSIAWAAKKNGLVGEIVGTARTASTRATAKKLGFIDSAVGDPAKAVKGAAHIPNG